MVESQAFTFHVKQESALNQPWRPREWVPSGARRRAARRRGSPGGAGPTLVTETKLPYCVDHCPDNSQAVRTSGSLSHWCLVAADTETTSDPPVLNSGRPHSANSDAGPNSRATTPSRVSRIPERLARSSTSACSTIIRPDRSAATTARSARSQRRSLASTRVQRDIGNSNASRIPTAPAPAPQSTNMPTGSFRQSSKMNPDAWRRSVSSDKRPMTPAVRAGAHASSKRLSS